MNRNLQKTAERYESYRLRMKEPAGQITLEELAEQVRMLEGEEFILSVPLGKGGHGGQ